MRKNKIKKIHAFLGDVRWIERLKNLTKRIKDKEEERLWKSPQYNDHSGMFI